MAESRLASTQQSLSAVMASVWTSCEMPSAMQIDFLLKYVSVVSGWRVTLLLWW